MTSEYRKKSQLLSKKLCDLKKSGIPVIFEDLDEFRNWMIQNGWDYGKKLGRKDPDGPWSPDNCILYETPMELEYHQMLVARWNNMVEPIRERFKEELAEIERRKPKGKEYFQYEHPDLVRKGIMPNDFIRTGE